MELPELIQKQILALPKNPGVYFFRNSGGDIMYIGKATSLRDRVRSYWAKELNRSPSILKMVTHVRTIEFEECDSSVEALISEANYIKHYLPKYNVSLKDDKSYFYVKLDNSDRSGFPRLSLVHKNEILFDERNIRYFGPYTSSRNLRLALKIIRRIFPYRSCTVMPKKACLQYHIHRCPAPCVGLVEKKQYSKQINRIIMILEGKKQRLLLQLKREMQDLAKKQLFEDAAKVRNQFVALQHLREAAKISDYDMEVSSKDLALTDVPNRIEGFDVSNTSGKEAVVSMVVFMQGRPEKRLYKRFKIRGVEGPNDYAMLQEAMERRLLRANISRDNGEEEMINERTWDISDNDGWQLPDLFLIDGGRGQISSVQEVLDKFGVTIPVVGMAKGPQRKNEDLYFNGKKSYHDVTVLRAVRDEAHRFAVTYHRLLRDKHQVHSELDAIPGVGETRRKQLLKAFGSVQGIKAAGLEKLSMEVGPKLAKIIVEKLGGTVS